MLPWWLSGKESTCQCRRHRFNPWSRKISHAVMQLSPSTTTTELVLWRLGAAASEARVAESPFSTREATAARECPLFPTTREYSLPQRRLITDKKKKTSGHIWWFECHSQEMCWRPSRGSWRAPSLSSPVLSDVIVVVWKRPWWDYWHHGSQLVPQIRLSLPTPSIWL